MEKQHKAKKDYFITNNFSEKLIELTNAIVLVLDKNANIRAFNKFAEKLTGYSKSKILGKNWFDIFIPTRDQDKVPKVFNEVLHEMPDKSSYENTIVCKDKSERLIAWNNTVLRNKNNEILGSLSIGTDITKARLDQIDLQLKDQVFKVAITANSITNDKGIIIHANKKFLDVWGYNSFSDIIGKPISAFIYNKNDAEKIVSQLNKSGVWEGEYEGLKEDGSLFNAYGLATVTKNTSGDVIGYQSTVMDITERKSADLALVDSENRFRSMYENLAIGAYRSMPDGRILFANRALFQLLGYEDLNDLLKINLEQTGFNPNYSRELFRNIIEVDNKILGIEAEWVGKDGRIVFVRENAHVVRDNSGKIIYYEGTAEDITERKLIDKALIQSQVNLNNIFNLTSDSILIQDLHGIILDMNRSAEMLFGYKKSEIVGHPEIQLVDRAKTELKTARKHHKLALKGIPQRLEWWGKKKDGTSFPEEVILNETIYNGKKVVLVTIRDITDRKKAEEALQESEQKHKTLTRNIPGMVYRGFSDWSSEIISGCEELCGYKSKEINSLKNNWLSIIHPDDVEETLRIGKKITKSQGQTIQRYRIINKMGSVRWVEDHKTTIFSDQDKFIGIDGIVFDITDYKLAEDTVKQSETNFRNIFDLSYDAIFIKDRNLKIIDVNKSASKLFGFSRKEFLATPEQQLGDLQKNDYELVDKYVSQALEGQSQRFEWWGLKKDGTSFPEEIVISRTYYNNEEVLLFTIRDITKRKKSEIALKKSEKSLISSQKVANLGSYTFDIKSTTWTSSKILNKIFGINDKFEKSFTGWLEIIHPDHRTMMQEYVTNDILTKFKKFDREYKIQRKSDGKVRWVHGLGNLEFDIQGNPYILIGTIQDITDRKVIELALVENERRMQVMMGNLPGMVYRRLNDKNWTMRFISEGCLRITGYAPKSLINNKVSLKDIIHPDDVKKVQKRVKNAINGKGTFEIEFRVRTKSGEEKIVWEQGVVVQTKESNKIYIEGYIWDVTARIKSEQALKDSHDRYEGIFEGVAEGIAYMNHKGNILAVNSGFENITGLTKEELVGNDGIELAKKNFSLKQLPKFMHLISPALKGEPLKNILFEFNDQILEINVPKVKVGPGVTVIIRDITERIEAQSKLERARIDLQTSYEQLHELSTHMENVREEERTSIAREIHDELGQAMTAIKMDLNWMEKKFPDPPQVVIEKTLSMRKIIDDTIQSVKRISSELRPGLLDDLGLSNAIEWQAEEFQSRTGIKCNVRSDPEEIITDKSRSTVLFRILQEALTNVARHSKATNVKIRLKDDIGLLRLTVIDNGIGITDININDPSSYGLKGIQERVYPWRGTVSITGTKGKGTILIAIIPQNE